jgi:hypothetical protein
MDLCGLLKGPVSRFHEHGRLMHLLVTYKEGRRGRGYVILVVPLNVYNVEEERIPILTYLTLGSFL